MRGRQMDRWLAAALDYIPGWLEFQMRQSEQLGCVVAVAQRGRIVFEQAFGHADLAQGIKLTPRHRFRVASHSKSFTACGIMKLRERGKLRFDDAVGQYIGDLHKAVAQVTIAQLLSHSAGIVRDGADSGHWQERRRFPDVEQIRADLGAGTTIEANTRFKYSNYGYGPAGLVSEAGIGVGELARVRRRMVEPARRTQTEPDLPLAKGTLFARVRSR